MPRIELDERSIIQDVDFGDAGAAGSVGAAGTVWFGPHIEGLRQPGPSGHGRRRGIGGFVYAAGQRLVPVGQPVDLLPTAGSAVYVVVDSVWGEMKIDADPQVVPLEWRQRVRQLRVVEADEGDFPVWRELGLIE